MPDRAFLFGRVGRAGPGLELGLQLCLRQLGTAFPGELPGELPGLIPEADAAGSLRERSYNRALLRARLTEELQIARREGGTVAVLVWDVKRFRTINDSFGRDTGDALLREIAWRLGSRWPQLAHIARLSADYFGAYIVDPGDAADVARLLESAPCVFA